MAEERTLGVARALDTSEEETSKAALQRRMEEARDSITNTVTEIKENVSQQYENVKDALDWREHFKKQPVAWSLGAAGVGFFVGYGLAAAITGDDDDREEDYELRGTNAPTVQAAPRAFAAKPVIGEPLASSLAGKTNGEAVVNEGPGLLERFKETSAYDRLSKEAGSLGDRLVEELSATAQEVVLPALLKKIKTWIGVDLATKSTSMAPGHSTTQRSAEPSLGRAGDF